VKNPNDYCNENGPPARRTDSLMDPNASSSDGGNSMRGIDLNLDLNQFPAVEVENIDVNQSLLVEDQSINLNQVPSVKDDGIDQNQFPYYKNL